MDVLRGADMLKLSGIDGEDSLDILYKKRLWEFFSLCNGDKGSRSDLSGTLVSGGVCVHREDDSRFVESISAAMLCFAASLIPVEIYCYLVLVSDFYKRPNSDISAVKASLEEVSPALDNQGVKMLCQIRHGTCHARAILFKVLADSVGLDSRLMVGLPRDGVMERTDSYKHMSVIVEMNSAELLVDIVRFPGQLIPCSTKAIFLYHTYAGAESDSADNDSCDSPLEPNSPLCGFSERVGFEGEQTEAEGHHAAYKEHRPKTRESTFSQLISQLPRDAESNYFFPQRSASHVKLGQSSTFDEPQIGQGLASELLAALTSLRQASGGELNRASTDQSLGR
ncbi:protein kinase superfamily protein [Actinidia rufa]|uniref:Protein kinase superfamily protein n=1 Tax=Actinidia rufa TaxID=165716 RepID=A0A7J0ETQ3_9ERIC|nr:protein kinase superfamily protein [Actinidia rufa]